MDNVNTLINRAGALCGGFNDLLQQSNDLLAESETVNTTMSNCYNFRKDQLLKHLVKHSTDKVQLQLLQENSELKDTVQEYQVGIEKLMAKYREHCDTNMLCETYNLRQRYIQKLEEIVKNQNQRIEQMASIMDMAADLEDRDNLNNQLIINKLTDENKLMRRQLQLDANSGQPITCCQEDSTQVEEHELAPLTSSDDSSLKSFDSYLTCRTSGYDNVSFSSSLPASDLDVERFISEAINEQSE